MLVEHKIVYLNYVFIHRSDPKNKYPSAALSSTESVLAVCDNYGYTIGVQKRFNDEMAIFRIYQSNISGVKASDLDYSSIAAQHLPVYVLHGLMHCVHFTSLLEV